MKKEVFISILCTGLMLVTPFTTIAQENKVSSNLSEQPDIDGLVAQIRVVINEILEKYGHNPTVTNLCKYILNILDASIFGLFILTICILSLLLIIPILALFLVLMVIFPSSAPDIFVWVLLIVVPWEDFCVGYESAKLRLPLKTIYSFAEINDILEVVSDCPCLQEN